MVAAGDEVRERVALTVRQRRLADLSATLLESMRAEVATWLHDGQDNRGALLGRLLWGVEHRRHLTGIDRRALRRASAGDWAALLPRNAWAYHARGFAGIRPTPGRHLPLDRPPSRRWLAPLLCGAGAAPIVAAVLLQLTAGPLVRRRGDG